MATISTGGQSTPYPEDRHHHYHSYHHHSSTSVSNLTKLIDVELDLLKESFEEAKRRIGPMMSQINQARDKFELLLRRGEEEMIEMERELRDLKQETSKLKLKIPFNLITPEYQPSADPNVIFQPNNSPVVAAAADALLGDKSWDMKYYISDRLTNDHPPIPQDIDSNSYGYRRVSDVEQSILWCFLAFPEGALIKTRLLCSLVNSTLPDTSRGRQFTLLNIASVASELVSEGFINHVYTKHSSTTAYGFWMDPFVHRTLKDHFSREAHDNVPGLVNSSNINGEDIFYDGPADTATFPSGLKFLHLGKWQRFPTHHNIEMPDPNLYFKYVGDSMHQLKYISFRGVSVMKELPDFIPTLKDLRVLDLKACHHLEVIPSDIGNLWSCLVHLDMSECYFLDHMPASLSQLTRLSVLKGFFVGETNNEEESCTLQDLSSLRWLMKLHIYTNLKTFPSEDHLKVLQGFKDLRNLTICWGGCPTRDENRELIRPPRKSPATHLKRLVTRRPDHPVVGVNKKFSFSLKKLDLRGAPETGTGDWLKPSNFQKLEKLYIRGGQLSDLKHAKEAQKDKQLAAVKVKGWSVMILRLRHLSRLQMHWSEVQNSFPSVVSVEKVDCPNLTSFPCDDDGLWTKDTTRPKRTNGV